MYEVRTKKAKKYIICAMMIITLSMFFGCTTQPSNADVNDVEKSEEVTVDLSAEDSLKLLEEGDARFVSATTTNKDISVERREDLSEDGQYPFAVIVSCSDSRVPPELIFDRALGDLFVVRVAGNVIDPVSLGSIEYAVEHLETHLVVVMGHEKCGAVQAALEGGEAPGSIGSILEKIQPSIDKVKATGAGEDDLYEKSIDENIKNSVEEIEKSPIIEHLVESGKVKIVGAKYDLDTGKVEFLSEEE